MQDIVILGGGGFAREVAWLIEENNKLKQEWNILGYIAKEKSLQIGNYRVLGDDKWLLEKKEKIALVCAVGNSKIRNDIILQYRDKENFYFPNIISHDVSIHNEVKLGQGCIICKGSILTVDIIVGEFMICNLNCTIGHDVVIGDFVTINPGAMISGNVIIENFVELGTGCKVIQGKRIGKEVMLGAGAVVVDNIPEACTAVGVPAKPIKFSQQS